MTNQIVIDLIANEQGDPVINTVGCTNYIKLKAQADFFSQAAPNACITKGMGFTTCFPEFFNKLWVFHTASMDNFNLELYKGAKPFMPEVMTTLKYLRYVNECFMFSLQGGPHLDYLVDENIFLTGVIEYLETKSTLYEKYMEANANYESARGVKSSKILKALAQKVKEADGNSRFLIMKEEEGKYQGTQALRKHKALSQPLEF